jgi:hypothetical protein
MRDTYKPGEAVPRTGEVKCTQHPDVHDTVEAGETFPPGMDWGEHDRKDCTWEYV